MKYIQLYIYTISFNCNKLILEEFYDEFVRVKLRLSNGVWQLGLERKKSDRCFGTVWILNKKNIYLFLWVSNMFSCVVMFQDCILS